MFGDTKGSPPSSRWQGRKAQESNAAQTPVLPKMQCMPGCQQDSQHQHNGPAIFNIFSICEKDINLKEVQLKEWKNLLSTSHINKNASYSLLQPKYTVKIPNLARYGSLGDGRDAGKQCLSTWDHSTTGQS